MPEFELEKLLGGFATDTLTAEEKQALYRAALQDQQLFDALADEQALKELLSNPDVRRRLLASLGQRNTSSVGGSLSWLEWLRRPAGLAFAGGFAAAVLAVALGSRIYQDSLRQAAQSVESEVAKPASPLLPKPPVSQPPLPQHAEPEMKSKEAAGPAKEMGKKDGLLDRTTKQERRVSDSPRDPMTQQTEQGGPDKTASAPLSLPSKSTENVASTADQKLAASSTRPAAVPESLQMEKPAISARALFYATVGERMSPARPLGLRYSFVVREANGQEREVDIATASQGIESTFLTLEVNQDAYLQIWRTAGSSTAQLQLPEKQTGQLSLKMTAGHRQYIRLSLDREPATLTARLSLVPFGPITREGTAKFDRSPLHQLQESITELNQTGSPERATYVVNQNLSTSAQIAVDIILVR